PHVLAATEDIPRDDDLAAYAVAATEYLVRVPPGGSPALQSDGRNERARGCVKRVACGVAIRLGGLDRRIVPERRRERVILALGQARQATRKPQIVRLGTDGFPELGTRIVERAPEFRKDRLGGGNAFARLL